MGGLINALFGNLIQAIMGKGIEAAGERASRGILRNVALAVVLLGSAWIAVAGAFLWTCERLPGVHGLLQYVQQGAGPGWTLAAPGLAALAAIVALLPVTGRHSLGVLVAAATSGFTIAALANLQRDGHSGVGWSAISCVVVALVLPLLALALAFGDTPPLDSALSHVSLVYWGRLRHLKALRRYGQERGLEIREPNRRDVAMRLAGIYDAGHLVRIASGANFKLSTDSAATYFLEVRMGSPRDIIAFRIGWEPAPKQFKGRLIGGELKVSALKRIYYYVVPDKRLPIGPEFAAQMARVVEAGRPFLRGGDYVQATPYGIRYFHRGPWYGMRVRDAALDPTIAWLRQLVGLLETATPGEAVQAPAQAATAARSRAGHGGQPGQW